MQITIGGSPSTGSSLLRQMLNRHSAIYCGPETKLFAYPQLFRDWKKYRHGLYRAPLITAPDVHLVRGSNLAGKEQIWEREDIVRLIRETDSIGEFAANYFDKPCDHYGKSIWAEKTPTNVLTFHAFASEFDSPVLIHIVRDPLDTIASLRSRGLTVYAATARYLYSIAFGLSARQLPGYVEVRYEALVSDPTAALQALFSVIGLKFEQQMLNSGNPVMDGPDQMQGWTSRETDKPSSGAIGRFSRIGEFEQNEILQAIYLLEISDGFAARYGLELTSIPDIAAHLGYVLPDSVMIDPNAVSRLNRARLARMMFSLSERRTFLTRERPIKVRSSLPSAL